jgi:hypothetical protein
MRATSSARRIRLGDRAGLCPRRCSPARHLPRAPPVLSNPVCRHSHSKCLAGRCGSTRSSTTAIASSLGARAVVPLELFVYPKDHLEMRHGTRIKVERGLMSPSFGQRGRNLRGPQADDQLGIVGVTAALVPLDAIRSCLRRELAPLLFQPYSRRFFVCAASLGTSIGRTRASEIITRNIANRNYRRAATANIFQGTLEGHVLWRGGVSFF